MVELIIFTFSTFMLRHDTCFTEQVKVMTDARLCQLKLTTGTSEAAAAAGGGELAYDADSGWVRQCLEYFCLIRRGHKSHYIETFLYVNTFCVRFGRV